jgi:hypothetical protein
MGVWEEELATEVVSGVIGAKRDAKGSSVAASCRFGFAGDVAREFDDTGVGMSDAKDESGSDMMLKCTSGDLGEGIQLTDCRRVRELTRFRDVADTNESNITASGSRAQTTVLCLVE